MYLYAFNKRPGIEKESNYIFKNEENTNTNTNANTNTYPSWMKLLVWGLCLTTYNAFLKVNAS